MASWFSRYILSLFWQEKPTPEAKIPKATTEAENLDANEPSIDIFEIMGFVPSGACNVDEQAALKLKGMYTRAFDYAFPLLCSQYKMSVSVGFTILKHKAPLIIDPFTGALKTRYYDKTETGFTCIKLPSQSIFLISISHTRRLLNEISMLLLLLLDSATTHFHRNRATVPALERRIKWFSRHPEFAPYVDSALSRLFS